ncbi:MAG: DUF559 domain-containing protein [Planctomycetes bacterium]|nr:DUF559 domain-containing protein [Candidatus Atribacteria bacterium]MBE3144605.1 DUF559 domain-containing protein [Planctomycetota bacterium]
MQKSKRTTPKMMHRAGELRTPALAGGAREEQTPAEAKLWATLRAHRTDGVGFRRQHAIGFFGDRSRRRRRRSLLSHPAFHRLQRRAVGYHRIQ